MFVQDEEDHYSWIYLERFIDACQLDVFISVCSMDYVGTDNSDTTF